MLRLNVEIAIFFVCVLFCRVLCFERVLSCCLLCIECVFAFCSVSRMWNVV